MTVKTVYDLWRESIKAAEVVQGLFESAGYYVTVNTYGALDSMTVTGMTDVQEAQLLLAQCLDVKGVTYNGKRFETDNYSCKPTLKGEFALPNGKTLSVNVLLPKEEAK